MTPYLKTQAVPGFWQLPVLFFKVQGMHLWNLEEKKWLWSKSGLESFFLQWEGCIVRRFKNPPQLLMWAFELSAETPIAACSAAPSAGQDAPSAILVGKRRALLDKGHWGLVLTKRFRANSKETGMAVMLEKTNWKQTSSVESIKAVIHNIFFKDEKNAKSFYFPIFSPSWSGK